MDCYDALAWEALSEHGIAGRTTALGKGLDLVWQDAEDDSVRDKGRYATVTLSRDVPWDRRVAKGIAEAFRGLTEGIETPCILVAGMGNDRILCDRLGVDVVGNLVPSARMCLCCPGVRTRTGMDTADVVRALSHTAGATLVVAVDTLVCRAPQNLMRSVQLSDAGLRPGGGVGQNCKPLLAATLGVPVLSIGVPMLSFADPYTPTLCVTAQDIQSQLAAIAGVLAAAIRMAFDKEDA